MWKFLYLSIAVIGFLIRQYLLPNPFESFGLYGILINIAISGVIGLIAYFVVGLFYESGSAPFIGSLLYLIVYSVFTLEIWLAFKLFPHKWLVGIVLGIIIFLDGFFIKKIRDNIVG